MKIPRRRMMNARSEFQLVRSKGASKVGKYMVLSTLPCETLSESKFAFVTSKKVGKAHERNFVRRRFRDLISRHGDDITDTRYIVMIGRYSAPGVDFALLEAEFLKLSRKLGIISASSDK